MSTVQEDTKIELLLPRELGAVEIVEIRKSSLFQEPDDVSAALASMNAEVQHDRLARWGKSNISGAVRETVVPEMSPSAEIENIKPIAQIVDTYPMITEARAKVANSYATQAETTFIDKALLLTDENFAIA